MGASAQFNPSSHRGKPAGGSGEGFLGYSYNPHTAEEESDGRDSLESTSSHRAKTYLAVTVARQLQTPEARVSHGQV